MKKLILGFAAISLLLGAISCQKETGESIDDGKGIAFKTALGKQTATKVGEFKVSTWDDDDQLKVYSYYTGSTTPFGPNPFTLTLSGTSWSYQNPENQPGVALRYYSVYPEPKAKGDAGYTDGAIWGDVSSSNKPFSYIVKTSGDLNANPDPIADAQEDLIAATMTTVSDQVTLQFKHLLSQVNFAVQGMLGVEIKVSAIKLNNVTKNGTYNFPSDPTEVGTWSVTTATTDNYNYYPITGTNSPTDTLEKGISAKVIYLGNAPYNSYNKTNALMLMPQSFASDATTKPTLTFGFSLLPDRDGNGVFEATADDTKDGAAKTGTITVDLCDFETTTWLSGKRYVYVIDFTSYLAGGPITFKVVVDEWVNDADNTTVETLQVSTATQESIEAAIARHSTTNASKTALKVFPISVAQDPTEDKAVVVSNILGFNATDLIKIEFPTEDGAALFNCVAPGWGTPSVSGRVVTLTCGTPNTVAYLASTVSTTATGTNDKVGLDDLTDAFTIQNTAKNTTSALKVFPIKASTVLEGAIEINTVSGASFVSGDIIHIICSTKAEATGLTEVDAAWSRTQLGNIVTLKKD